MAIPTNLDPNQKLYQVRIRMGSPYRCKGKDIDDYRRELTFDKSKKTRQEIGAIRQYVNSRRSAGCMPFFGAYITNQLGRDQLVDVCKRADQEMKAIDPSLHVTPVFLKIDTPALMSDRSLFDELLGSMRTQIHQVVLNRIKTVIERSESKTMTNKTKQALIRMLDKTQDLNIINDPTITAEINRMRERVQADQLAELRDEILVILNDTADRESSLEIIDPVVLPADADDLQDKIEKEEKTPAAPGASAILDLF